MLLHIIRNYFSSLSQLQAPFSNLLTRANNRGPYFFSSIFYELFDGLCLTVAIDCYDTLQTPVSVFFKLKENQ